MKTEIEKRRALLERLVWKHTHSDFKSKRADGTKVVNHYVRDHGTCSCPISSLTEAECLEKIPKKIREEKGLLWSTMYSFNTLPARSCTPNHG